MKRKIWQGIFRRQNSETTEMQERQEGMDLFSGKQLRQLIFPLVIEQILAVFMGMADIIMVASCGEEAVSGISIVDTIKCPPDWIIRGDGCGRFRSDGPVHWTEG
jgi:Na+-driven multidrug efflux pump